MNLLESAAKAAGQVGTLYAENLIREDVLAKRDERLRAINKEDREARYAQEEKMLGLRADLNKERDDTQWKRDQLLSEREWQRKQNQVQDTITVGNEVWDVYADGRKVKVDEFSSALEAEQARESRAEKMKRLHEERVAVLEGDYLSDEREAELKRIRLQEQLAAAETPEERQSIREQAEIAALRPQMEQLVKGAQKEGHSKEEAVQFYRSKGMEVRAKALEKYWDEFAGGNKAGGQGGAEPQISSQDPEYQDLPTDKKVEIANREIAAEKRAAKQEQQRVKAEQEKLDKENEEWKRHESRIRAFVDKELSRAPIPKLTLRKLDTFYPIFAQNVGRFSRKELQRINAGIKAINEDLYEGREARPLLTVERP